MLFVKTPKVVKFYLEQIQGHYDGISEKVNLTSGKVFPLDRDLFPSEVIYVLGEI